MPVWLRPFLHPRRSGRRRAVLQAGARPSGAALGVAVRVPWRAASRSSRHHVRHRRSLAGSPAVPCRQGPFRRETGLVRWSGAVPAWTFGGPRRAKAVGLRRSPVRLPGSSPGPPFALRRWRSAWRPGARRRCKHRRRPIVQVLSSLVPPLEANGGRPGPGGPVLRWCTVGERGPRTFLACPMTPAILTDVQRGSGVASGSPAAPFPGLRPW